jgi:hypothetical protein
LAKQKSTATTITKEKVSYRASKNFLSLVVMMTAVNLWKAQQVDQTEPLDVKACCASIVFVADNTAARHRRPLNAAELSLRIITFSESNPTEIHKGTILNGKTAP